MFWFYLSGVDKKLSNKYVVNILDLSSKHELLRARLGEPSPLLVWSAAIYISPDHEFSLWIDPLFNILARPLFCSQNY